MTTEEMRLYLEAFHRALEEEEENKIVREVKTRVKAIIDAL